MSLLHADGFNIYGITTTGTDNMLAGVYAEVGGTGGASSTRIETTFLRGIGTHCLHLGEFNTSNPVGLRWVNPGGAVQSSIQGAAFYVTQLPPANDEVRFFQWRDASNADQCTLWVTTTGVLELRLGNSSTGTLIGSSITPVIVTGSYQFVECFVRIDDAGSPGGAAECRVDGQVVFSVTGVDTKSTANVGAASFVLPRRASTGSLAGRVYAMDWYICDLSGSVNNDFLGDVQWVARFPDADGSSSAWTRNTGSNDFEMLDDNPQDGDTTYVEATAAGNVSTFGVADLPGSAGEVVAVVSRAMLRKTSPGDGSVQVSIVSGLSEANGVNRPMTEVYTYYTDIFETDPATSAVWSPAAVNAALLKLDRTL